jgi:acetate kinase
MRDLLARSPSDARAADAVAVFCYQIRKFLGAYVAVLCGLDTLVFTGGIGENSPEIRARICDSLDCFGIQLDPEANAAGEPIISRAGSSVAVHVVRTDEESVIARHTLRVMLHGVGADHD